MMKNQLEQIDVETENPKKDLKFGILISSIVILVWGISGAIIYFTQPDWVTRGQIGDMFGTINSLFSGLAFAGLIYTIMLQRKELSLQRKELRETRTVFQEQSSLLKSQQQISIFFNMLENHRALVKSLNQIDTNWQMGNSGPSVTRNIVTEGHELLNIKVKALTSSITKLRDFLKLKSGETDFFNSMNPRLLLYFEQELIHVFVSIHMIIRFIINRLENDLLYHETLFNALTKNEKFMLGVFIIFDFKKSRILLEQSKFNYAQEYSISGYFDPEKDKIPIISFKKEGTTIEKNAIINSTSSMLMTFSNNDTKNVQINKITWNLRKSNQIVQVINKNYHYDLLPQENFIIDILEILDEIYFDHKIKELFKYESVNAIKEMINLKGNQIQLLIELEFGKEIYEMRVSNSLIISESNKNGTTNLQLF